MKRFVFVLSLLCLMGFSLVYGQGVQVTGKVTDSDDGSALPGVSIVVQGTTIGAVTDFEGNYSITVPGGDAVLMFSFVGKVTQTITVGAQTTIDVAMEASTEALDEVVVTALGIKREKREVTYQTQKVTDDELVVAAPTRAAASLAGKVSGLQINIQDNGVNPSTQILLRGMRSITRSNAALIVIDGSIATQGAFDALNPQDIEDVQILKGALAAAAYGSDAANGALLVTTKSGSGTKKLTVGVSSAYTQDVVAYMPKFQTEYGTGWEGAYDPVENTNWGPRFDNTMRQIGPTFPADHPMETQMVPYGPVENNLLNFYDKGSTWNNSVYISGADKGGSIYASFGDQRSKGIVPFDTYRRNNLRMNAKKKIGNLEVSLNTNFMNDNTDIVGSTIGDQDRTFYWFVLNTSANIPLDQYWDWDNPLSYGYADNYYNAYYQNPYWAIGTNRNIDESNRFTGNLNVSWDITNYLNFTTRLGVNNSWGDGKNWRAAQEYDHDLQPAAGAVSSFVEDFSYSSLSYTGDALLSGSFDLSESFTLSTMVGGSVKANDYVSMLVRANNLSIPGFFDVSNGTGSPEVSPDASMKRVLGVFGEVTLGMKNFLFVTFTGRNDWTSTLSPENNSYFYPAISGSFVFTDAIAALQNNSILSYGKLTAGNSTVYNDLSPYRINESYSQSSGFPYGDINGFYLSNTAVDANITKEKLNTTEIGLELGLFGGRANFYGSWYTTKTSDLITFTTPSVSSGSTSFLTNIGSLRSTGYELALDGDVLRLGNGLTWNVGVNFTQFETVVEEIYEGLDEVALTTTGQRGIYAVVGEPFPQMKANVYQRDPEGRIIVDPVSGHPLTETELESLGKTLPDLILGLTTSVRFKGLKLSAVLDYRTGHVYYEQGSDAMEFTGRSLASVSANRQDFVIPNSVIETAPGVYEPNTNIAAKNGRQSYWTDTYNDVKSNYVKDASALKIRELALTYELPGNLLERTNAISKVTVGFVSRNLMTWLPAENMFADPEFNNTNNNAVGIGGYFTSPPTKSYGFSVNIEF